MAAPDTTSGVGETRSPAVARRLKGWVKGACWGAAALTILITGGIVAGATGFFIAGLLLVYAIPVWGFTRTQRWLAKKGGELATSVGEVEELIDRDAAAFRRVFAAIFPWRPEVESSAEPVAARRTSSAAGRRSVPAVPATARIGLHAIPHDVGVPRARPVAAGWDEPAAGPRQSFWRALTVAEREALSAVARRHTYPPGAVLCREGRPARHVMVIQAGWTEVYVEHPDGERVIARRGPGDVVGERVALRPGSRSATVVAVETVHALVVATEDFAAFVRDHPRLLGVLEGQIYGRLTEDRDWPPPARTVAGQAAGPAWRGQNCSIVLTDIAAFGARHRNDRDRRTIRLVMYQILREAFEGSGVRWADCHRDDRGDGVLVIVPPSTPTRSVVHALVTRLAAGLRRHNGQASEATRIQLRASLAVGPVDSDPEGVSGQAIIHAARLLDAPILKRQLAETAADLGFIVSRYVHDNVITHDTKGDLGYRQVRFQVKESRITGWMHLAGSNR
jgi:hypothetical protein